MAETGVKSGMATKPIQPSGGSGNDRMWALRQALAGPRRYIQPWYTAYLLFGIVTAGIIPVLLPIMLAAVSHRLATVAWVMGAYNLGLFSSPLWGLVAERRKCYRALFTISLLSTAGCTALLSYLTGLSGWLPTALVLGVGSAGAATVATLFIVDFAPREEWEPRIGWLQSFNSAGQVLGLLLAGFFSQGHYVAGLWAGGLVAAASLIFAGKGLPAANPAVPGSASPQPRHFHLDIRALAVFPHLHFPSGVGFHLHRFSFGGLKRLPGALGTPFGLMLLSWFALVFGGAGFFTYFPLMLAQSYGIGAGTSSLIYALVTAAGIGLSIFAGALSARYGSRRVHMAALGLRLAGFVLLLLPTFMMRDYTTALAVVGFAAIVLAWSVLSVTGTTLAARLTPFSEGEAMGLMNVALASAVVAGTVLSGPLVGRYGYTAVALLGVGGLAVSLILAAFLPSREAVPLRQAS